MKKTLWLLALALVMVLICGAAFADGDDDRLFEAYIESLFATDDVMENSHPEEKLLATENGQILYEWMCGQFEMIAHGDKTDTVLVVPDDLFPNETLRLIGAHRYMCGAEQTDGCIDCGLPFKEAETWLSVHIYICNGMDSGCTGCGLPFEEAECTEIYHSIMWEKYDNMLCIGYDHCGEESAQMCEHTRRCTDPNGGCVNCGANGDSIVFGEDSHNELGMKYSDEECWYVCQDCNEIIGRQRHYVNCNEYDPKGENWCSHCGKELDSPEVMHNDIYWDVYENDEGELIHYSYCYDCGAGMDDHTVDSDDFIIEDIGDNMFHKEECAVCGMINYNYHSKTCGSDGTECEVCGADGVTISDSRGHMNVYGILIDEYRHGSVCNDCGRFLGIGDHYGKCGDDYCLECGAEGVELAWKEEHSEIRQYIELDPEDEEHDLMHKAICVRCGEEVYSDFHHGAYGTESDFGTCVECGAENVCLNGMADSIVVLHDDGTYSRTWFWDDGSKYEELYSADGNYIGNNWYENADDMDPTNGEILIGTDGDGNQIFEYFDKYAFGKRYTDPLTLECIRSEGANYEGTDFFILVFDRDEQKWIIQHWMDKDHNYISEYSVMDKDQEITYYHESYDWEIEDGADSYNKYVSENDEEIGWEFYEHAGDTDPTDWIRYSDYDYSGYADDVCGAVEYTRSFTRHDGSYGTEGFRTAGDVYFIVFMETHYADNSRVSLKWVDIDSIYREDEFYADGRICERKIMNSDFDILSDMEWVYYNGVEPIIHEHVYGNDGIVVKMYREYSMNNNRMEREYDGSGECISYRFISNGMEYIYDDPIMTLPEDLTVIGAEAFENVQAKIFVLSGNVQTIESGAFPADAILLVYNWNVGAAAENAGYTWYPMNI